MRTRMCCFIWLRFSPIPLGLLETDYAKLGKGCFQILKDAHLNSPVSLLAPGWEEIETGIRL